MLLGQWERPYYYSKSLRDLMLHALHAAGYYPTGYEAYYGYDPNAYAAYDPNAYAAYAQAAPAAPAVQPLAQSASAPATPPVEATPPASRIFSVLSLILTISHAFSASLSKAQGVRMYAGRGVLRYIPGKGLSSSQLSVYVSRICKCSGYADLGMIC